MQDADTNRPGLLIGIAAWTLAALLGGAAGARGDLTLSHLQGEAPAVKLAQAGGAIRFTAEARPGDAAGWSLGARRLPGDPPTSIARFDWPNGTPVPFVLSYDGRRTVSLTVFQGDREATASFVSGQLADCDEIFLSAVASGADTGAALAGLKLGDLPVKSAPAAPNPSGGQDVLRIQGGDLAHGFTLTGALTLSWRGARPAGSDLHVLFWGAKAAAPAGPRSSQVTITAPAPESILANGTPTITAAFASGGGAVDPSAVLLRVDGADRTAQAEVGAAGLTFTPPSLLLEGRHTVQVIVRGPSGQDEQASVSFMTDTVPPSIAFASPPKVVAGNPAPIIRLTYSDLTSGLDTKTLKVTLDGESIDSICVANFASAVCIPQSIAEGSHLLAATIRDHAGNEATATFAFTLTLNEESE